MMEKLLKDQFIDRDVYEDTGISESPQARLANQVAKAGEEPLTKRSNLPPRRKKNEALVLKHYRLHAIDVKQTEAIAHQRGLDLGDLVRKQYERGVNVDTALGAPDSDGLYGLYQGSRLAELLRADIDGLICFALNHGVIPTMLAEYRRIIEGLNETIQSSRPQMAMLPPVAGTMSFSNGRMDQTNQQPEEFPFTAVTEMADEADGVLDMFFGNAERSDESSDAEG